MRANAASSVVFLNEDHDDEADLVGFIFGSLKDSAIGKAHNVGVVFSDYDEAGIIGQHALDLLNKFFLSGFGYSPDDGVRLL